MKESKKDYKVKGELTHTIVDAESDKIHFLYICIKGFEDDNMMAFLSRQEKCNSWYADYEAVLKIIEALRQSPNMENTEERIRVLSEKAMTLNPFDPAMMYFDGKSKDIDEFLEQHGITAHVSL